MAHAITAYADKSGRIHKTLAEASAADDAINATEAWAQLVKRTSAPHGGGMGFRDGPYYPMVEMLLRDRPLILAVFAAVDKAKASNR